MTASRELLILEGACLEVAWLACPSLTGWDPGTPGNAKV